MSRARASLLPDGNRLHLQDGPIDLIIAAEGAAIMRDRGFRAATARFATLLDELCAELSFLRSPAHESTVPEGIVARRMHRAVMPYARKGLFITPMAAVAGAVAEEILAAITGAADLDRASVNNGGDIALHLQPGESVRIGLVDRPDRPSLFARATVTADMPVRGVATSGWRGRSFSLGIADAVTVLAATASRADAAATIVANAVDLPHHPAVTRRPARNLQPDSDLGDRPVTCAVGPLTAAERAQALSAGSAEAERLRAAGLIHAAALHLAGDTFTIATMAERLDHA
jgi:uncharacterized protein